MKANALLKLHEKQCRVIEMIIDCEQRNAEKKSELKSALKDYKFSDYISFLIDRSDRNEAIKQRLISYYKDIQIRIMTLQPEIELNTTTEMDIVTTLS